MHINVIVERNERAESTRAQECYTLTQHQHQDEGAIKIQTLTYGTEHGNVISHTLHSLSSDSHSQLTTSARNNYEYVAVPILNRSRHKQSYIDGHEQREKCQEHVIISQIRCGQLMWHPTLDGNRFLGWLKWQRHQPSIDAIADYEEIN